MMFDETRLREALRLQRKSYQLLLWAKEAVREGWLKMAELHGSMSTSEAARSWIERNLSSLPPEARPEPAQARCVDLLRDIRVPSRRSAASRAACRPWARDPAPPRPRAWHLATSQASRRGRANWGARAKPWQGPRSRRC